MTSEVILASSLNKMTFFVNFTAEEKHVGPWANIGGCEGIGENKNCGPGSQEQARTCIDGISEKCDDFDKQNIISCKLVDCAKQLGEIWNNEGECEAIVEDRNCGPGLQQQTRSCKDGTNDTCTTFDRVRKTPCLLKPCEKEVGEWNNYGGCKAIDKDKNCGPGLQQQTRSCRDGTNDKCMVSDRERKISCQLKDCKKEVGEWKNHGRCEAIGEEKTCGPGLQQQTRSCIDGTVEKCQASDRQTQISCSLPDCIKVFGQWKTVGNCKGNGADTSCGQGYQREVRSCKDGTISRCTSADKERTVFCKLPKCVPGKITKIK